jgi:hypothetical protein
MDWIIIYWLASQSPDAAPHYMGGTSFGSQEYCEEFGEDQDDWSRFQCAVHDGGPITVELDSIVDDALTDSTICEIVWRPPLSRCD